MTVTAGSDVNGYIIRRAISRHRDCDVFEVVSKEGGLLYLYMLPDKKRMPKVMTNNRDELRFDVKPFHWEDKFCYIHGEQDMIFDYFNVDSQRAGAFKNKRYGDKIVRAPMPFDLLSDYEGENDDDDEDDDDYDDDDDSNAEHDDELDLDDDDGETFYDERNSQFYTCDSTSTEAGVPSILLHKDQMSGSDCHVEIQTPKWEGLHRGRHVPRTPVPAFVQTEANEREFEKKQDQLKCDFELKMVASAMLKRREAKSLAI